MLLTNVVAIATKEVQGLVSTRFRHYSGFSMNRTSDRSLISWQRAKCSTGTVTASKMLVPARAGCHARLAVCSIIVILFISNTSQPVARTQCSLIQCRTRSYASREGTCCCPGVNRKTCRVRFWIPKCYVKLGFGRRLRSGGWFVNWGAIMFRHWLIGRASAGHIWNWIGSLLGTV